MSKASFYCTVKNINGKHDIGEIKRELGAMTGIFSVSVDDGAQQLAVDFDTSGAKSEQMLKKLKKLGYETADSRVENHIM